MKLIKLIGLLGFIGLVVVFLFSKLQKEVAEAVWFDGSWPYRVGYTVTNGGSALTNYQVKLTLNTANLISLKKLQSSCADIRVASQDGTSLTYWLENNTCNTTTTAIWTKVPTLAAGTSTIYVYYGNSSAADSQSGTNTFELFDDFSGS